jgi:hypothetical protein
LLANRHHGQSLGKAKITRLSIPTFRLKVQSLLHLKFTAGASTPRHHRAPTCLPTRGFLPPHAAFNAGDRTPNSSPRAAFSPPTAPFPNDCRDAHAAAATLAPNPRPPSTPTVAPQIPPHALFSPHQWRPSPTAVNAFPNGCKRPSPMVANANTLPQRWILPQRSRSLSPCRLLRRERQRSQSSIPSRLQRWISPQILARLQHRQLHPKFLPTNDALPQTPVRAVVEACVKAASGSPTRSATVSAPHPTPPLDNSSRIPSHFIDRGLLCFALVWSGWNWILLPAGPFSQRVLLMVEEKNPYEVKLVDLGNKPKWSVSLPLNILQPACGVSPVATGSAKCRTSFLEVR